MYLVNALKNVKDVPDYQTKGIKAWFEIANFSNHIPVDF